MRYELGPTLDFHRGPKPEPVATPDPAAPAKADPVPNFLGVSEETETATFGVPEYDASTSNPLAEIRVYLAPSGTTVGDTAAAYLESALPFGSSPVAGVAGEGEGSAVVAETVSVQLPPGEPGAFIGRVLYGYKS